MADEPLIAELSSLPARRSRSRLDLMWRRYSSHKPAIVSMYVFALLAIAALFAPWINEFLLGVRADEIDPDKRFLGHTVGHWLGTDQYGRDLLARVLEGARVSLSVGLSVVVIGSVVGLGYGLVAAYSGGIVDNAMMRVVDTLLAIPTFYIILAVAAMKRVSLFEVILFIALTSWMGTARLVRAEVLSLKEREYILAVNALGAEWYAHNAAAHSARRHASDHRRGNLRGGGCHHGRVQPEFPGGWYSGASVQLGELTHECPVLYLPRPALGSLPGTDDNAHRT